MMLRMIALLSVPGLVLVLFLASCGGGDSGNIVVRSSDQLRFEPRTIRVKAGETVRLTLDNSRGKALHDLTLEDIPVRVIGAQGSADHGGHGLSGGTASGGLHVAAEAGKKATVEFVVEKPGSYAFYCSVSGHRLGGMEGTIIVVEA
jgi:plastocyanin